MPNAMKKYIFLFISILVLAGCSNATKDTFITTASTADGFVRSTEVVYTDSTISIKGNESDVKRTYTDTLILHKNKVGYYMSTEEGNIKFAKQIQVQVLSLRGNTFFTYKDEVGRHDIYTIKLDSLTYLSTHNAYGMATQSRAIYYDADYKILRIDERFGPHTFVFTSSLYKGHKIPKIPPSAFLDTIEKDSLEYSRNLHIEQ
jgi:hypothetical protein